MGIYIHKQPLRVQVQSPGLSCGVGDYNSVLARYSSLFNLRQIYGNLERPHQEGSQHNLHLGLSIPANLQPPVLSLSAQKLGSELKSGLSRLIDDKLARCIDTLVETLNKRLQATADLIEVGHQLEIVRNKSN